VLRHNPIKPQICTSKRRRPFIPRGASVVNVFNLKQQRRTTMQQTPMSHCDHHKADAASTACAAREDNMSRRENQWTSALLSVVCMLLGAAPAKGQATTGSILGRVIDPSGVALPEARIAVVSERTGVIRKAVTDGEGAFVVSSLTPDVYTVTMALENFKTVKLTGVILAVDQKMWLEIPMDIGDLTEIVEVMGSAPVLQTQAADTGEVIGQRQIQDLPLLGRNFLELTRLTTGTTSGQGGNNVNLSVNGQREFGNSVMVDGVEVTGNRNNDTGVRPSIDAVQEFKVVTSAYMPEFGRAAGGVIAIQTRSGANELHGGASEFYRPKETAAKPFFATERPRLKQHNFAGTLGGPIRRDHTFFFGSYEGVRLSNTFGYLDSVPPQNQIRFLANGGVDLSGLRDPNTGQMIPIFDPEFFATNFYAQQFPGNVIPAARVSPAGRAVLQRLFPQPNRPGLLNGWFNNFAVNQRFGFDSDTADARVDHILRQNDRLSLVYHLSAFDSTTGDRFAGAIPVEGGGDGDASDRIQSVNNLLLGSWMHVSPGGWVLETRAAYNHFRLQQLPLVYGGSPATDLGLANINLPGFEATEGLPNLFLGFGAYTGGSTFKPLRFLDRNVQVTSSLAGRVGRHDLKAGVDTRRLSARPDFSLFPTGFLYFGGPFASLTSDPNFAFFDKSAFYGSGGSDIADLLLGLPLSASLGLQLTHPETRSWEAHAFAQDSWRVTNRLTMMYGVRYEYQAPFAATDGQAANFDPGSLSLLIAGRGPNSAGLISPDHNNIAPRLGVAWQVTPRTVIRGGWGLYYTPENDARSDVLTKNYPFATREDIVNSLYGGLPFSYVLDRGVARRISIDVPAGAASVPVGDVPNAANQVYYYVDPALVTGRAQQFNLVAQREITSTVTVEVGYVGSTGRQMPYAVGDLNRAGRLSPAIGRVETQLSAGESDYHSLQAKATRRLSAGLGLVAAYTFSKSIDNGPAPFNLGRNHQQPQDPFNLAAERALSVNDVRHNMVVSGIYELPAWRGAGSLKAALSGWQVNGILNMRSGTPFNVVRNGASQVASGLRPNLVGDPEVAGSERTLTRYFNVSAFSSTGLGPTEPGDAGRNIVRGPDYINVDLSLFKTMRIAGAATSQVRIEAFNLANTPHFANPNADLSRGDAGTITQTVGNARILQFALRFMF
jgi:Carboxypeptidase regulatory-like domain/TonB dependent receptor